MKRLTIIGVFIISLFMPILVKAAGSISVSGPNTAVVGSTITINVKLSTGESWEASLEYDKSLLQLTSSSAEGGGTYMVGLVDKNPSRSYTFKFKTLKSGNATIKIGSYVVYADVSGNTTSMSMGSKTIKIQTQAEIEASYSDDATLKSLSVEGYEISPSFDKKTYEYTLEVENEVEKVNIVANKNNSNARITGNGEVELKEGNNKIEIVVTAQKGNSLTYAININRKELNPISVILDNKNYTIVRKIDDLPNYSGFVETTVNYNGEEIPALLSEAIDKTIVGVKDEEGNISTYVFKDGKFENKYVELKSNLLSIYLIEKDSVPFKEFNKESISINNENVIAFKYKNLNNYYLVYGMDLSTGKEGYYLYDKNNNTFQVFDEELFNALIKDNTTYLYMLIGSLAILFISIIIIITLSSKKKTKKVKIENKENDNKKLDLLFDDIEKPKKTKKKKEKNEI